MTDNTLLRSNSTTGAILVRNVVERASGGQLASDIEKMVFTVPNGTGPICISTTVCITTIPFPKTILLTLN